MSTQEVGARYAPLGERLAPLGAVAVAVLAQVLVRDRIVVGPPLLVPVIETALGVVLILGDGLGALLIHDVVHAVPVSVQQLFEEGLQILVVLAVGFALLFWQLDRGGPNGRVQPDVERMSFWFTQDAIREYSDVFDTWQPRFLDYLYVAITRRSRLSQTPVPRALRREWLVRRRTRAGRTPLRPGPRTPGNVEWPCPPGAVPA